MAFVYFTIASITSIWYFALNTEEQGKHDKIKQSIQIACRYHLGSFAYGSFLLNASGPINYFVTLFGRINRYAKQKERNCIFYVIMASTECFFLLYEGFIKYTNINTYILMALSGRNFNRSSIDTYDTI